jgi:uncharacterized coiled-coil protein SlyX
MDAFAEDAAEIARLRAEITRLTERCAAYKGQVEAGAVRIEAAEKRVAELEGENERVNALWERDIAALDRAIAALRPAPPAQDALVEAIRERDEARAVWKDSHLMHVNLLAARILSRDQALHLAGATDYDGLKGRAEAAESQVTSLRTAIQSALAIDTRVGETADGAMIEVLTGGLSTLPSSSVEKAREAVIEAARALIRDYVSKNAMALEDRLNDLDSLTPGIRPVGERDSIDDTLDWLAERKENCIRLATRKTGRDREDYIEDASKYSHAISLIRREYRPRPADKETNGS